MPAVATPKSVPPQLGAGDRLLRSAVYCRAESSGGKSAPNGEAYDVRIVASTGRVARDGGIIEAKAWSRDLSRYVANPVVQWCHDYDEPPVGTCVYVVVDEARAVLDSYWRFLTGISDDEWDRFAGRLKALYAVKGLNACSVGFIVHEYRDPTTDEKLAAMQAGEPEPYWVAVRAELLEQSAVPVPSDPYALAVDRAISDAKRKGMKTDELEARWAAAKSKPILKRDGDPATAAAGETVPPMEPEKPADPIVAPPAEEAKVEPTPLTEPTEEPRGTPDVTLKIDAKELIDSLRGVTEQLASFRTEFDAMKVRLAALETARAATDLSDDVVEARVARWLADGERAITGVPATASPSAPDHRAITDHIARAFDARLTPKVDLVLQRRLGLPPVSTH